MKRHWSPSMKSTQKNRPGLPVELFDAAEKTVIAEVERRGLKPHVDEDGRLRGVWSETGYKKVEVAIVPVNAERGFFRNGEPGADIDVFIFTDNAGRFWLATADEVRDMILAFQ
jgi:hypothetical protein